MTLVRASGTPARRYPGVHRGGGARRGRSSGVLGLSVRERSTGIPRACVLLHAGRSRRRQGERWFASLMPQGER